jgi:hypothetical protein
LGRGVSVLGDGVSLSAEGNTLWTGGNSLLAGGVSLRTGGVSVCAGGVSLLVEGNSDLPDGILVRVDGEELFGERDWIVFTTELGEDTERGLFGNGISRVEYDGELGRGG